jgi:Arc/MetJ-type ribon-helix-helix transcriptional regulator
MREQNARTALRLSSQQRERIERLIREGQFKSISQVIRAALEEFLSTQGDRSHD